MSWLQSFFNTPARQALGWTVLGILGIGMAAGGVWFLSGDDGGNVADADAGITPAPATATPTRTPTPSPSPSPSPTATPTETPSPTATTRPNTTTNTNPGTSAGGSATEPEPEPTPVPTEPPVVAGGDYCPPSNAGPGTLPSGRVAGAVKVGGVDAAEGAVDVFLAFDGVLGPSAKNIAGAFRIDFYANTSSCANRVGAAISAYANGQYFPTGRSVGDGAGQLIPVTIDLP